MQQPTQSEHNNVYEVRFKNTRKSFFRNVNGLSLVTGDFVAVESDRGFDVGQISLGGILAQLQMRKKKVRGGLDKVKKIYRRATKEDLEKLQLARSREQETLVRSREIVRKLNIDMKMSEVEYQGDNTKAIFYYIADQRIDFRELIKLLAGEFRIRIEMKQIGLRFESALVGGIGSCGRELCCSTWLSDFKTVSTAAARYQNLSLNPMKISGQCGRLKCCLNFELDSYLDALKDIPKVDRIETEMGMAYLQKTDIFKRTMWFSYANDSSWIPLETEKVMQMSAMNKQGVKPASLRSLDAEIPEDEKEADFVDVVGQSVYKEDPKRKKKKKKKEVGTKGGRPEGGNPSRQSQEGSPRSENRSADERGPRTENPSKEQRPPRPEGQQRDDQPREQRREGQSRDQRRDGQQRDQRRDGQSRDGRRDGQRRDGQQRDQRQPRKEGQQGGPQQQNSENPRKERPQGGEQGQRQDANREQRPPRNESTNEGGKNFRQIEKRPAADRPNREVDGNLSLPENLKRPPRTDQPSGQGGPQGGNRNNRNNRNKGRGGNRDGNNRGPEGGKETPPPQS